MVAESKATPSSEVFVVAISAKTVRRCSSVASPTRAGQGPEWRVGLTGPDCEEGRPFEHEAPRVARRGQAVEEPLVHEAQQDELEVVAALLGQAEQPDTRPGADFRLALHTRASR